MYARKFEAGNWNEPTSCFRIKLAQNQFVELLFRLRRRPQASDHCHEEHAHGIAVESLRDLVETKEHGLGDHAVNDAGEHREKR